MKRLILSLAVIALAVTACKKNADQGFNPRGANAGPLDLPYDTVPSVIEGELFLDNEHIWILDGKSYADEGAIVTIQEGTRIEGVKKDSIFASALVITRGAQLIATGSETSPIVFTAHLDANNPTAEPGDWGGVVILGKAPVNKTEPTIEGINLPTVPAGIDVHYGGNVTNDNSGELQYVIIEYAGASIGTDNELNGLTFGGVGCGTIIDFVEVAYGADDAFEWFGGTVNCKHLYALAPNDDAFDFDFGFKGSIQFAVSQLRPELAYSGNPNGIECDNDATGSSDAPNTKPQISNMTVIGLANSLDAAAKSIDNAALLRRNSAFNVKNSIFMGFTDGLNHTSSNTNADKNFSNNLVQAYVNTAITGFPVITGCGTDTSNHAYAGGNANDIIQLENPFGATPDYRPKSGSPALTLGRDFSCFSATCTSNFIQSVNYRGAFGSTNWLAGWAKYSF